MDSDPGPKHKSNLATSTTGSTDVEPAENNLSKLKKCLFRLTKDAELLPRDFNTINRRMRAFKYYYDGANQESGKREKILRDSGILNILVDVMEELISASRSDPTCLESHSSTLSIILYVVGNTFSVDLTSRIKLSPSTILETLHKIMLHKFLSSNYKILYKTLHVITTVLSRPNCRPAFIKLGLLESILQVMKNISESVELRGLTADTENVLIILLKCIKVCASEKPTSIVLNGIGAMTVVSEPLFWTAAGSVSDSIQVYILNLLDILAGEKMSGVSKEGIYKLTTSKEGKRLLQVLITLYRDSIPQSSLYQTNFKLFRNFFCNAAVNEALVNEGIYGAIFHQISKSDDPYALEYHLVCLKHLLLAGVNRKLSYISYALDTIASFQKVLRMKELQHHHIMIWWLYENLPIGCLSSVFNTSGLMEVITGALDENYGVLSLNEFRKKLSGSFFMSPPPTSSIPSETSYSDAEAIAYRQDVFSPVFSPGQSSPGSSSGVFSLSATDEDECYSPVMSDPRSPSPSVMHDIDETEISPLSPTIPDDGPSPKRIKLEFSTSPVLHFSAIDNAVAIHWPLTLTNATPYRVSLIATVLNVIKKLVNTYSGKEALYPLIFAFLGIFLDCGLCKNWSPVSLEASSNRSTFYVQKDFGDIFSSVTLILTALFQEEKLFRIHVTNEVQILLLRMKHVSHGDVTMSSNIEKLQVVLGGNGVSLAREWTLTNCLKSVDVVQRYKAAVCLPILFNCKRNASWYTSCAEVLMSFFEDTDCVQEFDFENVLLSVLILTDSSVTEWPQIQQQIASEHLPDIPYTEIGVEKSGTTVTFIFEDEVEVYIEKEFITEKSPVFQTMLEGYFIEAKEQRVKLNNFSKEGFLLFLELVTEGKINESSRNARSGTGNLSYSIDVLFEVLCLSHCYMVPYLYRQTLNSILASSNSSSSFLQTYNRAIQVEHVAFQMDISLTEGLSLPLHTMILYAYFKNTTIQQVTKMMFLKSLFPTLGESIVSDMNALLFIRF